MNKHLIITVVAALTLTSMCQHRRNVSAVQPKEPQKQQAAPVTTQEAGPFVPPADSLISLERMKAWLLSNNYLDSLTFRYADSFKITDPALRLRYQDDFTNAQNKICIRAGLPGGYDEYTWIMKNSGNPKNKTVLDSAHAETH